MDLQKIINSQELSKQKILKISKLKHDMQNELVKINDFGDRLQYVTFIINNIFNIINDEKEITYKEYKSLVKVKNRGSCKKTKKVKKYKGWKKQN
jgi:hypothetical protein